LTVTSPLPNRPIRAQYQDPLEEIWCATALAVGLRVERSSDTYASTDGKGRLILSDPPSMDADDCLAQMILHELCHSLVAGEESFGWVDWGLDNESDRDRDFELATLRVQAALLEPWGLRQVFAPTTDYRAYYDALPPDPFEERSALERPSLVRARAGYARHRLSPWAPHLGRALEASRRVVEAVHAFAPAAPTGLESLWHRLEARAPENRVHLPLFPSWRTQGERAETDAERTCAKCAWYRASKNGRGRCLSAGRQTRASEPACHLFEAEAQVDCLTCGACCREAYQVVSVSRRDPAVKLHRSWLTESSFGYDLLREGHRCKALSGGAPLEPLVPFLGGPGPAQQISPPFLTPTAEPFTCAIYPERPRTCRDFERLGEHCLTARRRVGLSP
jgi:Fe-S-cluster containining protein